VIAGSRPAGSVPVGVVVVAGDRWREQGPPVWFPEVQASAKLAPVTRLGLRYPATS
jgi:hypothetical protein